MKNTLPINTSLLLFFVCTALVSMVAQPTLNNPCASLSDYNSILLELNPIQKRILMKVGICLDFLVNSLEVFLKLLPKLNQIYI